VLIATEIWKNCGYGTVVYLAALTGIDPTLYEAAFMDGAGKWKQTLYITIPSIMPIVAMMAILNLGNILNAGFDQIFILSNPTVYETADIIDTLVYRLTVQSPNFGLATAVGLLKSAVTCIFMMSGYYILYKTSDYRIF
jgi:putative aldouronate transport system permease protein